MKTSIIIFIIIFAIGLISCKKEEEINRTDNAVKLEIDLPGSIQNPAFSPDGKTIVFTHFRKGYNKIPSDLYTYNLETKKLNQLVTDGNSNVNLPGESWNNNLKSILEELFCFSKGGGHLIMFL